MRREDDIRVYKHIYSSNIPTRIKHTSVYDITNRSGRRADFVDCRASVEEAYPPGGTGKTVSDPTLC